MKRISVYFNQIVENWSSTVTTNHLMNKIIKSQSVFPKMQLEAEKKKNQMEQRELSIFLGG